MMVSETFRRLPFVLPDFARLSWVSEAARDLWLPRVERVVSAWSTLEWRAISAGIRRCAIIHASPENFLIRGAEWAASGLNALPLEIQGTHYSYSATPVRLESGKPFQFRFVIGRPQDVVDFKRAFDKCDDSEMGAFLGYPSCCLKFFRDTWVDQQMVDTTWPMAVRSDGAKLAEGAIQVNGPPESNILMRWIGIRSVPHLPCRFNCPATVSFGRQFMELGRDLGFDQEMDWMNEILSWPVEWSALHGIAEIRTPVVRVIARTDATSDKCTVRYLGTRIPEEAARGIRFPYSVPVRPVLTTSTGYRTGLGQELPAPPSRASWYATDNGFESRFQMDVAHHPIVGVVAPLLRRAGGPTRILDLGCGNGALLARIANVVPQCIPFGVDVDPTRLAHARELLPGQAGNFVVADIQTMPPRPEWWDEEPFDVVLLMPGRLLEGVDQYACEGVRDFLKQSCRHLVVYAYGDWLERFGGLPGLCEAAGLHPLEAPPGAKACLAALSPLLAARTEESPLL